MLPSQAAWGQMGDPIYNAFLCFAKERMAQVAELGSNWMEQVGMELKYQVCGPENIATVSRAWQGWPFNPTLKNSPVTGKQASHCVTALAGTPGSL